jgi:hypothetical protein
MRVFFPLIPLPHTKYVPILRAASSPNEVAFFIPKPLFKREEKVCFFIKHQHKLFPIN